MRASCRAAWLAAAWLAVGCGGGGGGPSGPDVTPPAPPNLGLIDVNPPIPGGVSLIVGSEDAVEGSATVTVVNLDATLRSGTPVEATAVAAQNGAFSVSIPAQLGDDLELTATDQAGNESTVTAAEAGPIPQPFMGVENGDVRLFTFTSGEGAIDLPFPTGGERFTVVIQSLNPSGDPFELEVTGARGLDVQGRAIAPAGQTAQVGLETKVREIERRVMPTLSRAALAAPRRLAPAQGLGDRDTFFVANRLGEINITDREHFDDVIATLRFVGEHTFIFVDIRTPSQNLPDATLQEIGRTFDEEVYPTNVATFGEPSDVDGNDHVILLLTPTINALNTPEIVDAGSVFLGFFFGIDLLPDPVLNPFANAADIMYGVIPDPNAEFGAARFPLEVTEDLVISLFAHEFEHLISANQHVLVRNGPPEQTWLDEGLAHMAETLNGFPLQNRLRSALFEDDPQNNPLVGGEDNLERRGAAWLFVNYLADRFGMEILGELVQTRLTSTVNVDRAAGRSFPFLFHEWASTLYLDGQGISSDAVFDFPSLDLRAEFQLAKERLDPGEVGRYLDILNRTVGATAGNAVTRDLSGTAAAYYEVRPAGPGTFPLVIDTERAANLQVGVVRTE
ncbi:hypothetical protein BH18GEM1_BH18GEM1_02470 [soil metagenome]